MGENRARMPLGAFNVYRDEFEGENLTLTARNFTAGGFNE